MAEKEKLYPLNIEKYDKDFMLVDNYIYGQLYDVDMGNIQMEQAEYKRLQNFREGPLKELRDACFFAPRHGDIVWITGEQYGTAMTAIDWATSYRDARNSEHDADLIEERKSIMGDLKGKQKDIPSKGNKEKTDKKDELNR